MRWPQYEMFIDEKRVVPCLQWWGAHHCIGWLPRRKAVNQMTTHWKIEKYLEKYGVRRYGIHRVYNFLLFCLDEPDANNYHLWIRNKRIFHKDWPPHNLKSGCCGDAIKKTGRWWANKSPIEKGPWLISWFYGSIIVQHCCKGSGWVIITGYPCIIFITDGWPFLNHCFNSSSLLRRQWLLYRRLW